jgi:hypothetical protein
MTHHPHVHMIVPGGGIASGGKHWVSCRPGFFLPVRVLSHLFRRLFLQKLAAGSLCFFGDHAHLDGARAFAAYLAPLRKIEWVVYSKAPVRWTRGGTGLSGALYPFRNIRAIASKFRTLSKSTVDAQRLSNFSLCASNFA